MIIPFDNVGQTGLIKDLQDYQLTLEAWTKADNIRFTNGYAEHIGGHSDILGAAVGVIPYFLLPLQKTNTFYWIYAGLTKIYVTDGTDETGVINVTRQTSSVDVDYKATIDKSWTGTVLNGVPILNNGIDAPQMLYPVTASNKFQELTAWPTNNYAGVIKSFGNYLVALDITKESQRFPFKVKTSHQADPGTVPSSWDHTDPTKDATENELANDGGFLVDGGEMGDSFMIYRESSIWQMRYIGGRFIFGYREVQPDIGIYAKRCFAEFEDKHFVLTNNDIIVHDGNTVISIGDKKVKDDLFTTLDAATNKTRTFVVHNNQKKEVWICYPTTADVDCTKALIWNYRDNTFSNRTLPNITHASYGIIGSTANPTWDADTNTWDSDTTVWNERLYDPSKQGLLMAATAKKFYQADSTNQFDGTSYTSTLQRTGLGAAINQRTGKPTVDLNTIKCLLNIIPKISAAAGTVVKIRAGYQMLPGDTVTWGTQQSYTVGTSRKVDVRVTGRLLAVEFETTGNVTWKLDGFDLIVEIAGER